MSGKILLSTDCVDINGVLRSPVRNLSAVEDNVVICARFRDPTYTAEFIFEAKRYGLFFYLNTEEQFSSSPV